MKMTRFIYPRNLRGLFSFLANTWRRLPLSSLVLVNIRNNNVIHQPLGCFAIIIRLSCIICGLIYKFIVGVHAFLHTYTHRRFWATGNTLPWRPFDAPRERLSIPVERRKSVDKSGSGRDPKHFWPHRVLSLVKQYTVYSQNHLLRLSNSINFFQHKLVLFLIFLLKFSLHFVSILANKQMSQEGLQNF